jgi:PAS domain S-box-containing protein
MDATGGTVAPALVDAIADPAFVVDAAGIVRAANGAAERAFRSPRAELAGTDLDALVPGALVSEPSPGDGDDAPSEVSSGAPSGGPAGARPPTRARAVVARRPEGSAFPADVTVGPLPGGDRLVVVRDVGERALAERRIAELAAAAQAASDAVYVQGADGLVTSWNRSAERIYGYGASEAIGRPAAILIPPHRAEDAIVFERVMLGERVEGYETEQHRRDGTLVPVWLTVLPVRDRSGGVVGASYAARDVTELELAQATLADAQARLREGEALAHAGGWGWDAESDTMQWSDELYRIHGVDPLDFGGTLVAHLATIVPEDRARVETALHDAIERQAPLEIEYAIARPDGEVRQILGRNQPVFDVMGRFVGMRGVRIDMTERHEVEVALQAAVERERTAAQELRDADRLKDDFLSTVSHELRTPLTSIVGFAALLDSGDEAVDEETRAHLVHRIGRNAVEMHNMIEGLLDFTRLQAGRVELRLVPLSLAEHLRSVITSMASVLADHVVRVSVPDDLVVLADAAGLDRVLNNLLSNAAKFGPPGSTVDVGADAPGHDGDTGPSEAVIWVHDHGPGVPAEHRERIFERFFQIAPSHAGKRGAGVGLAVVRQYVELHNGRVWCESVPGEGSTFRFTLRCP